MEGNLIDCDCDLVDVLQNDLKCLYTGNKLKLGACASGKSLAAELFALTFENYGCQGENLNIDCSANRSMANMVANARRNNSMYWNDEMAGSEEYTESTNFLLLAGVLSSAMLFILANSACLVFRAGRRTWQKRCRRQQYENSIPKKNENEIIPARNENDIANCEFPPPQEV